MANSPRLLEQAVQFHRSGDLQKAEALYREILQTEPRHADAHHLLGVLANQTGHLEAAITLIRQAIVLNPEAPVYLFNLGNVYLKQSQFSEAARCFRRALALDPNYVDAHNSLGNALFGSGQVAESAQCYRRALAINPRCVDAHNNLGNVLVTQGQAAEAAESYRQASRIDPKFVDAHYNLGTVLFGQGQLAAAADCLRHALRINPNHANANNNLGNLLRVQGQLAQAVECYRQALRVNPNSADFHTNLGNALKDQGQFVEAAGCYRQALAINPSHVDAHNNLGLTCFWQGQFADASAEFQETLRIDPTHRMALWNRSYLRLLHGDYEGGWPDYEQRWAQPGKVPRTFAQPRWDGSPLEGKTVLLYAEQGLGDTIQFIRYAPVVKERGGKVLVECQPALVRLLEGASGIDQVAPQDSVLPSFDVQLPLLSLAGLFGTTLATIPNKGPYLRADPELVEKWRVELAAMDRFKIGIVWQGQPTQADDRYRSVPLAQFAPLANIPGVKLLSLQVGPGQEQLVNAPFPIIDLGSRLDPNSLHDLAAVLPNLDLVVTVCTSVAHLGGALGVPVWVALKFVPYWCWLLGRADSPWYPTVRLFRQSRLGEWREVFERIGAEISRALRS